MRNLLVAMTLTVVLTGCADATRTYPALVVEQRPIGSVVERPKLRVPEDRSYLPHPAPPRRPCFEHDTHCRVQ